MKEEDRLSSSWLVLDSPSDLKFLEFDAVNEGLPFGLVEEQSGTARVLAVSDGDTFRLDRYLNAVDEG